MNKLKILYTAQLYVAYSSLRGLEPAMAILSSFVELIWTEVKRFFFVPPLTAQSALQTSMGSSQSVHAFLECFKFNYKSQNLLLVISIQ